jgi:hypothetical protein
MASMQPWTIEGRRTDIFRPTSRDGAHGVLSELARIFFELTGALEQGPGTQDEGIARDDHNIHADGGAWWAAFQVPIGRLSDRFDRRIVLAALGLVFAVAAVALVLLDIDEAQKVKSR